jgi:hypothetical protein
MRRLSQRPHSRPSPYLRDKMWIYLVGAAAIGLVTSCATTQQVQPNILEKAQGAQNPVPQFSGFLGDYSLLQPGGQDQALYQYINPSADWSQYNAVMIDPIPFWGGQNSSVSTKDQAFLSEYFYNKLHEDLAKNFSVVSEPGPGVMRLRVAITDASAATPVLRTVSVVIPDARLLNKIIELTTGKFVFVGGARAEMKVTDSTTGAILAEALDQRVGGSNIQTAATWRWGDAERVMDRWCDLAANAPNELHPSGTIASAN